MLDNATGLRWQQVEIGPYSTTEAISTCAGWGYGGLAWRLATAHELMSIVDETTTAPAFDSGFFSGATANHDVGSNQPMTGNWFVAVNFESGQSELMGPKDSKLGRCVTTEL